MSTAKKKLTTCAPKTAVAYARYSSAHQRDVSIEQQLRDIAALQSGCYGPRNEKQQRKTKNHTIKGELLFSSIRIQGK